jgi:hypothetical protein
MKVHGRCHCGEITYEAEVQPGNVNVCHCRDCQILTGTAFRAGIRASAEDFHILTGKPREYTKVADSGARRVHAFCATCGSPVYSCAPQSPKSYSLRLGAARGWQRSGAPKRSRGSPSSVDLRPARSTR